ncbi:MAG: hypothetical protein NT027_17905 [Proteobacteria bacterium]|nr:hypothetical protein [Pseudomonadota bacterium]
MTDGKKRSCHVSGSRPLLSSERPGMTGFVGIGFLSLDFDNDSSQCKPGKGDSGGPSFLMTTKFSV